MHCLLTNYSGGGLEEKDKPYVCPHCRNRFHTSSDLKRHERTHSEDKLFQCSFENCSFCTHRKDSLRLHEKTHTGIESRLVHPCPSCWKTFSSQAIATRHQKTCGLPRQGLAKEPLASRETRCHHCGKEFSSVYKLATHKKKHEGTLDFQCGHCGKALASRAALNKHLLCHQQPRFQCELCSKQFSRRDNLQAHFLTHFKSETRPGGSSNLVVEYICSFCQRSTASKEQLMAHFESDPSCGSQCNLLARQTEVVREEVVAYDGESIGEKGASEISKGTEKSATETILVDHEIQDRAILIIEEPVIYC